MATRLYLPASGTPPLASLGFDANWELTTSATRYPCSITKSNTALANVARTWGAALTQQWIFFQYQTAQMSAGYSWTTGDTVSMVIRCLQAASQTDSHLAYSIRVVSADGSTVRGTVGLYHATSTEFVTTAATRIHSARTGGASNFTSYAGDRIIVEIGLHGVTPTLTAVTLRNGDPSATADFALTAGLTTDLCPWVELSRDVIFGNARMVSAIATGGANTVSGTLKGKGRLYGAIGGVAAVSGTLSQKRAISGATGGVASVSGTLSGSTASTEYIAGATDGIAALTGVLKGKGRLYGTTDGVAAVSGILTAKGRLQTAASGVAAVSGTLTGKLSLNQMVANASFDTNSVWETFGDWSISGGIISGSTGGELFRQYQSSMIVGILPSTAYEAEFTLTESGSFVINNTAGSRSFLAWDAYDAGHYIRRFTTPSDILGGGLSFYTYGSAPDGFTDFKLKTVSSIPQGIATVSGTLTAKGSLHSATIGSQILLNGTFDNSDDWTVVSSWSISGGTLNYLDLITQATWGTCGRMSVGDLYKLRFDLGISSGLARLTSNLDTDANPIINWGDFSAGVITGVATKINSAGYDLIFYGHKDSSNPFTIDNIELRQLTDYCSGVALVSGTLKGKGSLTGATTSSSSVSGVLLGQGLISGLIGGVASVSATLLAKGVLYGTINGVVTVSGTLIAKGKLYSITAGTANVSATLLAKGQLVGQSNGISTASAIPGAIHIIIGSSNGVATLTATMRGEGQLQGSVAGSATSTGTTYGKARLAGTTVGASLVSATLVGEGSLFATSEGTSTVVGAFIAEGYLIATIAGISVVSATLIAKGTLSGLSAGISTASSTLIAKATLQSSTNGISTVSAILLAKGLLSANINGVTICTAILNGGSVIVGQSAGIAEIFGVLTAKGQLQGPVAGQTLLTAVLEEAAETDYIAGATTGVSSVTGVLVGEGALVTITEGVADVAGTLEATGVLQLIVGSANGTTECEGVLKAVMYIQGISTSFAEVEATLVATGKLLGATANEDIVYGSLLLYCFAEGQTNGVALVSGTLVAVGELIGVSEGVSLIDGILVGEGALEGELSGVAFVVGTLTGWGTLAGATDGGSLVEFPYYTATTSVRTNPATNVMVYQMQLNAIAYRLTPTGEYHRIVGFVWGESPTTLNNIIYANQNPILLGAVNLTFTATITGLDAGKTYYFAAFGNDQFLGYRQSTVVRSARTHSLYGTIAGVTIVAGDTTICPYAYMDETIDGSSTVTGTLWKYLEYEEIRRNSRITIELTWDSFITNEIVEDSEITDNLVRDSIITKETAKNSIIKPIFAKNSKVYDG